MIMDKTMLYVTRLTLGWSHYQMGRFLGLTRHVVFKVEEGLEVDTLNVEKAQERLEQLTEAVKVHGAAAIPKPAPRMKNLADINATIVQLNQEVAA